MNETDIEKIINSVVKSINTQVAAGTVDLTPNTDAREIAANEKDAVRHVAIGADAESDSDYARFR